MSTFSQDKDSIVIDFEKKIKNASNDSLKVEYLLGLGTYQKARNLNQLPVYHQQVREIFKRKNYDNTKHLKTLLIQSGVYKRRTFDYSGALKEYLAAQKVILETNDTIYLGVNYGNIAMLYMYKDECEKAIVNFKKAIERNTLNKNYRLLGINYGNIAKCYADINQVDSAFYAFEKGIYNAKISGDEDIIQLVNWNKSKLLLEQKRYKEALPLQLTYLEYNKTINKHLAILATNKNIARTYFGLKNYDKALFHANEAIDYATKTNIENRVAEVYKTRGNIYKVMGKYELAFNDLQTYDQIQKEVDIVNNAKKFKEIEMANSFEKERIKDSVVYAEEKRKISLQVEKQKVEKQLYFASFIITVMISILIVYLGYQLYLRIKKKNKIKEEKLSQKIVDLNSEVTTKKEEVNQLLTETVIHLNTKEKLAENLAKLSKEEGDVTLKGIIADLKADKLEDSKILMLKKNIETLNYDFLKSLKSSHPNLTKTDIEVCSFIKIGLSRKEISNLRNTSLDAIKSTRFRLKKKLQLSADQSLDDYIKSL
ncbi:hypothetical protein GCM10009430_02100 [Aquimarina litoralis]|uniref:HTH luxR-type domain-containing protein n=1 Tax=Aquimarina litoralis TaxID=584605 RepID=A0ABP3TLM3_9FLAO